MSYKDVISLITTVISGFSQNGNYSGALKMFLCMEKDESVKPNHITVVSVLLACANLGELEIGRRLESYARDNGFFDNIYVCKLYAHGEHDEALKLYAHMLLEGEKPDAVTFVGLLLAFGCL